MPTIPVTAANIAVLQTQSNTSIVYQQGTNVQKTTGLAKQVLADFVQPADLTIDYGQSATSPTTTLHVRTSPAPNPDSAPAPGQVAIDAISRKEKELGAYLGKTVLDPVIFDNGAGLAQQYENGKVLLFDPLTAKPGEKAQAYLVE